MRTAVVTGAASGIGRALTSRLAADGFLVHLADIAPSNELAAKVGGREHHLDVTRSDHWERLAASVDELGGLDLLALNAGITGPSLGTPWEVPVQEWRAVLDVNLLGVVHGLRSFLPRMLTEDRPSRVLITASLAGLLTFPGGGAYAASKHALVTVAEQTALALVDTRVSVTLLCPALVRTGMSPIGADPVDIAAQALTACYAGRFLVVDDEWAPAITERTSRLLGGEPPQAPTPPRDPGA